MFKKVYVDFDGVLLDSCKGTENYILKKFGKEIHISDAYKYDYTGIEGISKKDLYSAFLDPEYMSALKPYEGTKEGIKRLKDFFEVEPYTQVDCSAVKSVRNKQIEDFGLIGEAYLSCSEGKPILLKEGTILVEDNLSHILKWSHEAEKKWGKSYAKSRDILFLLIDQSYNQYKHYIDWNALGNRNMFDDLGILRVSSFADGASLLESADIKNFNGVSQRVYGRL
jgi:hypothetical protein